MDADRTTPADVDTAPERESRVRRPWLSLLVGVAASALMLFPSWVGGSRLPLQNLWHEQTMPDDMPFALLPLSQYYAISIFGMVVLGGVLAGLVVRMLRLTPRAPAALGVLAVHVVVSVQSFAVLAAGLGMTDGSAGGLEVLYFGGMLGGVVVAVLFAQLGFALCAGRSVALAALGLALSAVLVSGWIGTAVVAFTTYNEHPSRDGAALGAGGRRRARAGVVRGAPVGRIVVWVVALLSLWVMPGVITALSYLLGSRALQGDLRDMADAAAQVFPQALGIEWMPVIVALAIGVVGTGVRMLVGRGAAREDAPVA
ncbi:hypothetical protein [Microbacterium sp. YJN-G]|uniref:hypothetical protein n=1 Tax=Microbacterium sp. YJN-G TaxID=2763257 RepID=UPI00187851EF|nr:hypothetical protein [Microbacterium sp. YJN-G]